MVPLLIAMSLVGLWLLCGIAAVILNFFKARRLNATSDGDVKVEVKSDLYEALDLIGRGPFGLLYILFFYDLAKMQVDNLQNIKRILESPKNDKDSEDESS